MLIFYFLGEVLSLAEGDKVQDDGKQPASETKDAVALPASLMMKEIEKVLNGKC